MERKKWINIWLKRRFSQSSKLSDKETISLEVSMFRLLDYWIISHIDQCIKWPSSKEHFITLILLFCWPFYL